MSVLTSKERKNLPRSIYALPEEEKFPIPDASHARNALARAAQFATPAQQVTIKKKVAKRFPNIKQRTSPYAKE